MVIFRGWGGVGHDNMNDKIICVIRNSISREPISRCTKIRPWGLMGLGIYFSSTSCVLHNKVVLLRKTALLWRY